MNKKERIAIANAIVADLLCRDTHQGPVKRLAIVTAATEEQANGLPGRGETAAREALARLENK